MEIELAPAGGVAVCAVCKSALGGEVIERWTCQGCRTMLHADCRAGLGRCPTLGCVQRLPTSPAPRRWSRRHRAVASFVLVGVVAALVGSVFVSRVHEEVRAIEVQAVGDDLCVMVEVARRSTRSPGCPERRLMLVQTDGTRVERRAEQGLVPREWDPAVAFVHSGSLRILVDTFLFTWTDAGVSEGSVAVLYDPDVHAFARERSSLHRAEAWSPFSEEDAPSFQWKGQSYRLLPRRLDDGSVSMHLVDRRGHEVPIATLAPDAWVLGSPIPEGM